MARTVRSSVIRVMLETATRATLSNHIMALLADETLARWKMKPTREHDIPFRTAVRSLFTANPMIEALQTDSGEWNVST